jgi:hypothetical protein
LARHRRPQRIDLYEQRKTELATSNPAIVADAAELSFVQFRRIQGGRTGMGGRFVRAIQAMRGALRELLAKVLLVSQRRTGMNQDDRTVI